MNRGDVPLQAEGRCHLRRRTAAGRWGRIRCPASGTGSAATSQDEREKCTGERRGGTALKMDAAGCGVCHDWSPGKLKRKAVLEAVANVFYPQVNVAISGHGCQGRGQGVGLSACTAAAVLGDLGNFSFCAVEILRPAWLFPALAARLRRPALRLRHPYNLPLRWPPSSSRRPTPLRSGPFVPPSPQADGTARNRVRETALPTVPAQLQPRVHPQPPARSAIGSPGNRARHTTQSARTAARSDNMPLNLNARRLPLLSADRYRYARCHGTLSVAISSCFRRYSSAYVFAVGSSF